MTRAVISVLRIRVHTTGDSKSQNKTNIYSIYRYTI